MTHVQRLEKVHPLDETCATFIKGAKGFKHNGNREKERCTQLGM